MWNCEISKKANATIVLYAFYVVFINFWQTHGESRDFVCTECGKTFRQRQGLRVHLNIHKTEKPYQCPVCEKTFTQRGALVRHARTHTAERPYACKLCSSTFNDYSILRRHMLGIHKIEDATILRKTVKEACAEARDVERSRLTGQCKDNCCHCFHNDASHVLVTKCLP